MKRLTKPQGDEGFTLIELLVVVAIMPLVVGALAAGLMSLFTNSGTTQTRLNDSHDSQITSTYFVRDVQSAQYVSTSTTPLCGTSAQLLGVSWSSLNSSGGVVTNNATYSVDPTTDTLIRTFCSGGTTSTVVLAHDAFPAAPAPTVGSCPAGGTIGIGATSCGLAGAVAHAAVTVTCTDATVTCANGGAFPTTAQTAGGTSINLVALDVLEDASGFVYHLTAAPHGWSAAGVGAPTGGTPTTPALELLGNDPSASFQGGSSCSLAVNGVAAINSDVDGAITLGNNNTFTATGGVYAGTANPVTGGTSPPVTVGPPLADPYANLVPPTAATPGVHVITGTFKPNGELNGIYILQNGMSLAGNATITTGSQGVLLYVTGGSIDLTGGSSVDLSKPVSGYAPIVIWVDKSDSGGSVSLGGNGNVTTIGGTVYAPNGSVSLNGGGSGGGTSAGAIVANKLTCQGGGNGVGISTGPLVTTTTLSSSANPSADGKPVTLTAQVSASQTVGTGQVVFVVKDNTGTQTADCAVPATVSATGAATCVTGNLSAASGPYTATAFYQGNAAYGASTSNTLTQVVLLGSHTTITESPDPSVVFGQQVNYTAKVTGDDGGTPTGSVTFTISPSVTCAEGNTRPLVGGTATCTTTASHVSGSPYTTTAAYAGSATYAGSTSDPVSEVVTPTSTTTTVASAQSPSTPADTVVFTATVTPAPTSGSVTWSFTPASIRLTCPATNLSATVSSATCTVPGGAFAPGNYAVSATFVPTPTSDGTGSNGSIIQTVEAGTLASSVGASTPNNTNHQGVVTDTAVVTGSGSGGHPTGVVSFYVCPGATTGCTASTAGSSFVSTSNLAAINGGGNALNSKTTYDFTATSPGKYCLAAYYSGDAIYAPSQDVSANQCFTN